MSIWHEHFDDLPPLREPARWDWIEQRLARYDWLLITLSIGLVAYASAACWMGRA